MAALIGLPAVTVGTTACAVVFVLVVVVIVNQPRVNYIESATIVIVAESNTGTVPVFLI